MFDISFHPKSSKSSRKHLNQTSKTTGDCGKISFSFSMKLKVNLVSEERLNVSWLLQSMSLHHFFFNAINVPLNVSKNENLVKNV